MDTKLPVVIARRPDPTPCGTTCVLRRLLIGAAFLLPALLAASWARRSATCEDRPPAAGAAGSRQVTCVFLVRHAERASRDSDSDLSEAGRKRAERLAEMLRKVPVSTLVASDRLRTRRTLEPISAERKLPVERISDPRAVADEIRALPRGSTAVVAHHSDTIPAILAALGLESPTDLFEGDGYSELLLILVPPGGKPESLRLTY